MRQIWLSANRQAVKGGMAPASYPGHSDQKVASCTWKFRKSSWFCENHQATGAAVTLYALHDGHWFVFVVPQAVGVYLLWAGCNVVKAAPLGS